MVVFLLLVPVLSFAASTNSEAAPYAPGELLVKYRATTPAAARIAIESDLGARILHSFSIPGLVHLKALVLVIMKRAMASASGVKLHALAHILVHRYTGLNPF